MGRLRGGLVAATSLVVTAVLFWPARRFDLQCDDLLVIRPWSRAELAGVWHGTWEPSHTFATFYRPLAAWFYAATFELFGWNATAHMLLSLAMLALVACLAGLIVQREWGSRLAGSFIVLVYLGHPNVPWSTGTWVTNDFHKLAAIFALGAVLVWQRVRHRAPAHWLLVLPFVVASFLVKEDGLMVIPALLSLQWLRARLTGDVRRPSVAVISIAAAIGAALVAWRYFALRELGGFGIPPLGDMLHNLARGPIYAFTLHGSLSALTLGEKLFALAVTAFVVSGIRLMPREQRFLPFAGLIIMFWYDLPLALISNVMRYYMLTIASAMVLAPVFLTWAGNKTSRWSAGVFWIAMISLIQMGHRQYPEIVRFAPCNWAEHNCVSWVLDEVRPLPPEARAYVADTERACAAHGNQRPHVGASDTLTWGLGATSVDTMTGERSNVVDGDVVTLIRGNAATAELSFRHPEASASHPIRVDVNADGARESRTLTGPEWLKINVPLTNGLRSWLRGAHRVDVHFSEPGAEWKSRPGVISGLIR